MENCKYDGSFEQRDSASLSPWQVTMPNLLTVSAGATESRKKYDCLYRDGQRVLNF